MTSAVIVGVSGPVLAGTTTDQRPAGKVAATVKPSAAHRQDKRSKPVASASARAKAGKPVIVARAQPPAPKPQPIPEPVGFLTDGTQQGLGTRYAMYFAGRKTASGDIFDPSRMTAAHRTLPMYTHVLVTNLTNGKQIEVTINDRGPFTKGRVIDLSPGAAAAIGLVNEVPVKVVQVIPGIAPEPKVLIAEKPTEPAAQAPTQLASATLAPAVPPPTTRGFSAGRSMMAGPVAADYLVPVTVAPGTSSVDMKLARGGDAKPSVGPVQTAKMACVPSVQGKKTISCP